MKRKIIRGIRTLKGYCKHQCVSLGLVACSEKTRKDIKLAFLADLWALDKKIKTKVEL